MTVLLKMGFSLSGNAVLTTLSYTNSNLSMMYKICLSFGWLGLLMAIVVANPEPKPITQSDDVYVENNDVTYTASIQRNRYPELICGACLVSERAVITAAECFGDDWSYPDKFLVKFGTWERTSTDPSNLKNIASIIRHPQYRPAQWEHNIAIVRVVSSFLENGAGRTFLIPRLPPPNSGILAGLGTITGWGFTSRGNLYPGVLYAATNVPIISNIECRSSYEKVRNLLTNQTICAGTATQHGCSLDQGGPLIVRVDGDYVLQGIQSSDEPCKAFNGRPVIYALISDSIPWIVENIS